MKTNLLLAAAAIVAAVSLWATDDTRSPFERAMDASRKECASRYPDEDENYFLDCWRGSEEEEIWLVCNDMYADAYPEKF